MPAEALQGQPSGEAGHPARYIRDGGTEVMRFFDGLELLEPGLVPVQRWRPECEVEAQAHSAMWGGVGRKPPG